MQRFSSLLALASLLIGSLYVSAPAYATPEMAVSAVTAASAVASNSTLAASAPAVAIPTEPVAPHIALLLPLKSTAYAKAADAVKQGFLAAASKEIDGLPVRIYSCADEDKEVVALYQQALTNGAVAVAGPLTRGGVAALAMNASLMTPTLALNVIDSTRSDQLYFFGLPPESEARQSALLATAAGLRTITLVSTNTALSKRLVQAFADEWQRAGGVIQSEITYTNDPNPLKALALDPGNAVFMAAELDKARLLRPYINNTLPVYATSQAFSGNTNTLTNYDLADVHFVDMPWLLQPDHPAVMIYPRATPALELERERLYALGIDAYRLLQILFEHGMTNALPLDGVTGKITLTGHLFQREAAPAVFKQGVAVVSESKVRP